MEYLSKKDKVVLTFHCGGAPKCLVCKQSEQDGSGHLSIKVCHKISFSQLFWLKSNHKSEKYLLQSSEKLIQN